MASRREIKNVVVLASCQALFQTGTVVIITAGGLAGHLLAADKSLATLPISFMMIGTMLTTIPASLFMGRFGRRAGFWLGTSSGAISATLAVASLINGWFWLFCFAHVFYGGYQGFAQFYRFAAAEGVSPPFRSRAISYVLTGPIVAAVAGPYLVAYTKDYAESGAFVATYAILILLSMAATVLVTLIRVPAPSKDSADMPARPLSTVARQPIFAVAIAGAATAYGVMNLAMTATPLAMAEHHHGIHETAFVIQWHVLGMFVPSFFTGTLIARYGAPQIMLIGVGLLLGHVAVALSGVEFLYFLSALVLLGVGWNFSYVGGTTLLTEAYRPSEKAIVQGVNDFTVFFMVMVSSFASGALLHWMGWTGVNVVALPFLILVGIALIMFLTRRREPTAPAARGA
jgi:MFS family permease